jgi:hypothetical protein
MSTDETTSPKRLAFFIAWEFASFTQLAESLTA